MTFYAERDAPTPPSVTRVGVLGCGTIGAPVVEELRQGRIPGCRLAGILTRSELPPAISGFAASSIYDLIDRSDLVVEAAGHDALATLGPPVIESGRDLLVLSVGVLVNDDLRARLTLERGGKLLVSTGAIGGLDILAAAMLVEPLDSVSLTSRKPSSVLIRPWMPPELQSELSEEKTEADAFTGTARDAVKLFPESANIAATLALATIGFDRVQVRIVGAPHASGVEHRVDAAGRAGSYGFVFRNRTAETNARTSAITPFAVIRTLRRWHARIVVGA